MKELLETRAAQPTASQNSVLGAWVIRNIWNFVLAACIGLWSIVGAEFYLR